MIVRNDQSHPDIRGVEYALSPNDLAVSTPPQITSISVSPSSATVALGSTQLFTATDQDGNPISVDWSSSDTSVGTISPTTGTSTTFTAIKAGAATVTATSGGVSGSAEVTVPDNIAPTTSISLSGISGNNGWYTGDVTVTLTAADNEGGTGVDITEYSTDGATWNPYTGTSFTISTEGAITISYRSKDKAGNVEDIKTQIVNIDKTAPLITITVPAGEYLLNQIVLADWSAMDSISGLASATGTKPSGDSIDTSSVGTKIFEVTASDNAGNSVTKTVSYHVSYNFAGFFRPIDNLPSWNSVKAGSAVPVKFNLSGDQGLDIFQANYPASQKIYCDSNAPIDPVEETSTAGSSGLSYNATIDQYNYVWKTDKAWAGSCRQLQVQLKDGTYHNASFKFLK